MTSTSINILFVINGLGFSNNSGIGGSDKRAIEIIRNGRLLFPKSHFDVLTTQSGFNIFTKDESLNTKFYLIKKPVWWPNILTNTLFGRMFAYLYSTIKSLSLISKLKQYDVVFATSDFFFDIIPSIFFKISQKKKIVAMVHHYIKNPFVRKGNFAINLFNYISQQFSFFLIRNFFNSLFLYNTDEGKYVSQFFKNSNLNLHFTENGIDTSLVNSIPKQDKKFEAIFVGGLRHSKGIIDLIDIWSQVTKSFPNALLNIVGNGSPSILKILKLKINLYHLKKNIFFSGSLSNINTLKALKQSKIFISPSYEEGWGIALHEAMYCGLPIISYNLPAYSIFKKYIFTFPLGNYSQMANKIVNLLDNIPIQPQIQKLSVNYSGQFTWNNIAKKDITYIQRLNYLTQNI